jgi:HD-like signal output (HDOD) protein
MENTMTRHEGMQSLISQLGELPTLPVVIHKINALISNPRTTANEVGLAIAADQAIAAKIIRLVNSALYGFPGRISSIPHAITILGFSTVRTIALTTGILSRFDMHKDIHGFDLMGLWKHSLATGSIARVIANHKHFRQKEEAFVGGLLHDLGKVVAALYLPQPFLQAVHLAHARKGLLIDAELEIWGATHEDIGAWVAEQWSLPQDLSCVLSKHHHPRDAKEHAPLCQIVHLADILARGMRYGTPGDGSIPLIEAETWEQLELTESDLCDILHLSESEITRASLFLRVNDPE